jgi:hypothetical protein
MLRVKTFTDGADSCTCLLVNEVYRHPIMACTSSIWSLISCTAAAISATTILGLGAAVFIYMKTNNQRISFNNSKEVMQSTLTVTQGFAKFLAQVLANFMVTSMVLMLGPLVYIGKVRLAKDERQLIVGCRMLSASSAMVALRDVLPYFIFVLEHADADGSHPS